MKLYDAIVFNGRMHPLHNAHLSMMKDAADMTHNLIIILGSADKARSYRNPFSTEERIRLISNAIPELKKVNPQLHVTIDPCYDITYNDAQWAVQVQEIVSKHTTPSSNIAMIDHDKDGSDFYRRTFPQWNHIDRPAIEPLDASQIRSLYFTRKVNLNFIKHVVPDFTYDFLHEFMKTEEYQTILAEREYELNYKKPYESCPYPVTHLTTDAVVIQGGHVLMIERKSIPGKGLLAFPGGFFDPAKDSSLLAGMLRELREETRLKVSEKEIIGSITKRKNYDAKDRSCRGRVVTEAFKIVLNGSVDLPKVKARTDAKKASWIPIAQVRRDQTFEDHYEILMDMLSNS